MISGTSPASSVGTLGRLRRSSTSDELLFRRARLGDDNAFEELYRRHHPSVFGYCLGRLANRHAAEDAAQEVFARAATSDAEVGNVRSWIFTIAHNVVVDAMRRRVPDSALLDLETVVDSLDFSAEESAFAALDTVTNVFIALRRLPGRERKALILREFQDRTSAEIAADLGTRRANVDVIVSRARAAFGRAYAEIVELPPVCRQATETIYRELGSGASERRLASMKTHLATCPRCRAEHRRAHTPRYLGMLAPLLQLDAYPRLAAMLEGLWPHAASAGGLLERISPAGWPAPVKAVLAVAVVGATLAPGAVDRGAETPSPAETPRVTLASLPEVRPDAPSTKVETGMGAATAAVLGAPADMPGSDWTVRVAARPMEITDPLWHDTLSAAGCVVTDTTPSMTGTTYPMTIYRPAAVTTMTDPGMMEPAYDSCTVEPHVR